MQITVATLTVDDGNIILTSAHPTMTDAEQCLFDNYDSDNQFNGDIQELEDRTGITAYFDTSTIDVPVPANSLYEDIARLRDLTKTLADQYEGQPRSEDAYERGLNTGVALSYRAVQRWLNEELAKQDRRDALQTDSFDGEEVA